MRRWKTHLVFDNETTFEQADACFQNEYFEIVSYTSIGNKDSLGKDRSISFEAFERLSSNNAERFYLCCSDTNLENLRLKVLQFGIPVTKILYNTWISTEEKFKPRNKKRIEYRWPDFLIAGAQKSGTTWLQMNLRKHPSIFMTENELNFYSLFWDSGTSWYLEHFQEASDFEIIGDKSSTYLPYDSSSEKALKRISNIAPHSKIIVVLRNPIDRLVSALMHNARYGFINLDFLDFDRNFILNGEIRDELYDFAIERGRYIEGIEKIVRFLGKERLKIVFYEEIVRSSDPFRLKPVFEFLDVCTDVSIHGLDRKVYESPFKKECISDRCRKILFEYYEPYNQRLFNFLGREIEEWSP